MCGGGDTVKRVVFPRNFVNNENLVRPYWGCVMWSN